MADRPPKSYDQLCPLAMALDHIGDRWSVLLIRELLGGPARFNDLSVALPGIASNLLTARLRRLEASGIVERTTVFGSPAYAITELGSGLRPALEALGVWGSAIGPLTTSKPKPVRSARSAAMGLEAMIKLGEQPASATVIDLVVGSEHLAVTIGGPRPPLVRYGRPDRPDGVVTTTLEVLSTLAIDGPPVGGFSADPGSGAAFEAFVATLTSALTAMADAS